MKEERISHPSYYNMHPSGVECIEVIRRYTCNIANAMKYLWRAGLKREEGLSDLQKEVEDCYKAVWYLRDHLGNCQRGVTPLPDFKALQYYEEMEKIAHCYCDEIANAFRSLLFVGLVVDGSIVKDIYEEANVCAAIINILKHIDNIKIKKS